MEEYLLGIKDLKTAQAVRRMDMCICMGDTLRCSPEIITY